MAPSRSVPARQRSLRDHNLGLALRLIAHAPTPVSRAQIAAQTGVSRATSSALVEELLAAGLVAEDPLPPTSRSGRPASGVRLAAGGPAGLGIEINVDYLATAVVDLTGAVLHHSILPGDRTGGSPTEVLRAAAAAGRRAAKGCDVTGVAIAVPGLVADGRVLLAPNLGWQDVDVLRQLPTLAGVPVTLGNEADYAALGELSDISRSFLHVSGEIGIGAGIVINGDLYRGSSGWAGELGHLTIDPSGPLCRCGSNGCLEVFAGQEALRRSTGRGGGTGPLGDQLAVRAAKGQPAVLESLHRAGSALGQALSAACNLLDVPEIVLGGIYAPLAPWLMPTVAAQLERRVLWSPLRPVSVRASKHGTEAAVRGAARSVVARLLSEPEEWLVTRSLSRNASATFP